MTNSQTFQIVTYGSMSFQNVIIDYTNNQSFVSSLEVSFLEDRVNITKFSISKCLIDLVSLHNKYIKVFLHQDVDKTDNMCSCRHYKFPIHLEISVKYDYWSDIDFVADLYGTQSRLEAKLFTIVFTSWRRPEYELILRLNSKDLNYLLILSVTKWGIVYIFYLLCVIFV